jgi:hypothetical protein
LVLASHQLPGRYGIPQIDYVLGGGGCIARIVDDVRAVDLLAPTPTTEANVTDNVYQCEFFSSNVAQGPDQWNQNQAGGFDNQFLADGRSHLFAKRWDH